MPQILHSSGSCPASARRWLLAAVVAPATVVGCSWFRGDSCPLSATRCSGDRIQSCVSDVEASMNSGESVNRWVTQETCADDSELGPYTCGNVAGRATCVPETGSSAGGMEEEGGGENAESSTWLRVHITGLDDGEAKIANLGSAKLPSSPLDPAWGMIAAVSYRGDAIVDATLVPLEEDQGEAFAWVAGEGVDRVDLVTAEGEVLSSAGYDGTVIEVDGSSDVQADEETNDDSVGDETPTDPRVSLRVEARLGKRIVPTSATMRELVERALERVPNQLLLVTPYVKAVLDDQSAVMLAVGETQADGDSAEEAELPEDFFAGSRPTRAGWEPFTAVLVVDLRTPALTEYGTSTLALTGDIVRALAGRYVDCANLVAQREGPLSVFGRPKLPRDFPVLLEPYLINHYAQLLNAGESPSIAWESLHQVAVEAGLARPYLAGFGGIAPKSNEEAVEGGLASTDGCTGAENDLVDYMARAAVPEGWSFGPCEALRAAPLDELSPPLLVHAAKLLALYGLGLLERGALTACVDALRIGERGEGALIFYKPDGDRLILTEELEGIRQPYFSGEVELSWKAQRSYLSASLSVGYRGLRPAVMRLQAVAGHEGKDFRSGDDSGAVLALTNPDGYQTSVVVGGLLVVTDVRRDALKAYALMAKLKEPIAGTKVFPLVSAQVAKPTWGDAP